MPGNKTRARHEALFDHMATACGADPDLAVLQGRLSPEALDDAVLSCTGCSEPDTCESLLAAGAIDGTPPSFCRNKSMLAALAVPVGAEQ